MEVVILASHPVCLISHRVQYFFNTTNGTTQKYRIYGPWPYERLYIASTLYCSSTEPA